MSEASHAPVMLELRIRACHVTGAFLAKDNASRRSPASTSSRPPRINFARLVASARHLHAGEAQGRAAHAGGARIHPREKLNEFVAGDLKDIGIIVQGGLYNGTLRALERLGLADLFGECRVPMLCLNVTYPLVPEEIRAFCADKKAVLIVEEGYPEYIEQVATSNCGAATSRPACSARTCCRRPANIPRRAARRASRNSSPKRGRQARSARSRQARAGRSRICRPSQQRCAHCRRGRRPSAPAARSARSFPPSS